LRMCTRRFFMGLTAISEAANRANQYNRVQAREAASRLLHTRVRTRHAFRKTTTFVWGGQLQLHCNRRSIYDHPNDAVSQHVRKKNV